MADTEVEVANLHIQDESIAESDIAILEGLLSTWQRRKEAVCFSIVAYHMHHQQYLVALQWLDKLMAKSPSDPHLKTKAAFIQLQLGDVQGAQRTFSDVKALVSSSSSSSELRNLVRRNRGILNVALGQFPEAIAEFDAVLAKDPDDIVSTNIKALCFLYNQQLLDATDTLEDAVVNRVENSEDERGPAAAPAPPAAPVPSHVVRGLGAGGICGEYRRETSLEVDGARDGGLGQVSMEVDNNGVVPGEETDSGDLLCSLCRGKVKGWKVVEAARSHLNQKLWSCAQEAFSGPYEELLKHAQCTHPSARPSEIDRSRLDRWMQLVVLCEPIDKAKGLGHVLVSIVFSYVELELKFMISHLFSR